MSKQCREKSVSFTKIRPEGSYTLNDIKDTMLSSEKMQPIDVVKIPEGGHTTIDNSRLLVAKQNQIDIAVNMHNYNEFLPESMSQRFEHPTVPDVFAKTWGEALEFRIMKQSQNFQQTYYPIGTYIEPKVINPPSP